MADGETPPPVPPHCERTTSVTSGFAQGEDGFMDDDNLMTSTTEEELLAAMQSGDNYIERDDFERELGSPDEDAFAEDFRFIQCHFFLYFEQLTVLAGLSTQPILCAG